MHYRAKEALFLLILLILPIFSGCTYLFDLWIPKEEVVSKVIRTGEEGILEHPSGAQIYVPRGAVPLNLTGEEGEMLFTIEEGSLGGFGVPSTPPSPGWNAVGKIYRLGPEGFTFQHPIRVTLPLPGGFNLEEKEVSMFVFDHATGGWGRIGGKISRDGDALSADVMSFSYLMLWSSPWEEKSWGAIEFQAVPGYSFSACIQQYTLKYAKDGPSFVVGNHSCHIPESGSVAVPPDGKIYWILPQGTYTIDISICRVRAGATCEQLGFYRTDVTIDRAYKWPWYEATPVALKIQPEFPGRAPCLGIPTPSAGVGALNVRLEWRANCDLDLWVIDPCGNKIYYDDTQKTCQGSLGQLDLDNWCEDFVLGRPENIFWSEDPPTGTYKIYVDYYRDCASAGTVRYTVRWFVQGKTYSKHGTISPPTSPGAEDDEILVTTFTY